MINDALLRKRGRRRRKAIAGARRYPSVIVGVEADVQATEAMLRAEFGPAVVGNTASGIAVG
jgi:hypothetical protein